MWSTCREQLANGRILKVSIDLDSSPVPFSEVLRLWQCDADFRSFFIAVLADAPFEAFRWETPPVTAASVRRPFEFVLLDSPALARKPDPAAFEGQFRAAAAKDIVLCFPNLGNDALLVVPRPCGPLSAYGHIASFLREASQAQKHALWEQVGRVMERQLGESLIWLSTAGAGVPWLHVRIDRQPKYYAFGPYTSLAAQA